MFVFLHMYRLEYVKLLNELRAALSLEVDDLKRTSSRNNKSVFSSYKLTVLKSCDMQGVFN